MDGSYLQIKTVILENGGRRPMLIDRVNGMPLVNPTFYLTSMIYLPGNELNTQRQVLSAIQFLYEWCRRNRLDLEARFRRGHFLDLREIEKLCGDIRLDFRKFCHDPFTFRESDEPVRRRTKNIIEIHRPSKTKSPDISNATATTAIKLSYVSRYLDWLAAETIGRVRANMLPAPHFFPYMDIAGRFFRSAQAIVEWRPEPGAASANFGPGVLCRRRYM